MSQLNALYAMNKLKLWKLNYFHVNIPYVTIAVIPTEINAPNVTKRSKKLKEYENNNENNYIIICVYRVI